MPCQRANRCGAWRLSGPCNTVSWQWFLLSFFPGILIKVWANKKKRVEIWWRRVRVFRNQRIIFKKTIQHTIRIMKWKINHTEWVPGNFSSYSSNDAFYIPVWLVNSVPLLAGAKRPDNVKFNLRREKCDIFIYLFSLFHSNSCTKFSSCWNSRISLWQKTPSSIHQPTEPPQPHKNHHQQTARTEENQWKYFPQFVPESRFTFQPVYFSISFVFLCLANASFHPPAGG